MTDDNDRDAARGEAGGHNIEQLLSGDFSSPSEVLAEGSFTDDQKREIFDVWLADLRSAPDDDHTRRVRRSVQEALATLDRPEDTQH